MEEVEVSFYLGVEGEAIEREQYRRGSGEGEGT